MDYYFQNIVRNSSKNRAVYPIRHLVIHLSKWSVLELPLQMVLMEVSFKLYDLTLINPSPYR